MHASFGANLKRQNTSSDQMRGKTTEMGRIVRSLGANGTHELDLRILVSRKVSFFYSLLIVSFTLF